MTVIAGDTHIWTITTDPVPVAACGYSPDTMEILNDVGEVVGTEVVHAAPTGDMCADCLTAGAA